MNDVKKTEEVVDKDNKKETAASLVEYALLVALIAVVCIAAITILGTTASEKFSEVASALD
ncbi:MAG: Flp family type IVb pilin [Proteobacteria bacterium]|nr:MAG: Flp family type IVb pilin [Pseudomonadota bacterium]